MPCELKTIELKLTRYQFIIRQIVILHQKDIDR